MKMKSEKTILYSNLQVIMPNVQQLQDVVYLHFSSVKDDFIRFWWCSGFRRDFAIIKQSTMLRNLVWLLPNEQYKVADKLFEGIQLKVTICGESCLFEVWTLQMLCFFFVL